MFLQGNLQIVFDALYHMGIIDPILKMDWAEAIQDMDIYQSDLDRAVEIVNRNQTDIQDLVNELSFFDSKTLEFLAMEVAKEYADFHTRTSVH